MSFKYAWNNISNLEFTVEAPWAEEALRQVDTLLWEYSYYWEEYSRFDGSPEYLDFCEKHSAECYEEAFALFSSIWPLLAVVEEEEEEEEPAAMDEGPGSLAHNRARRF